MILNEKDYTLVRKEDNVPVAITLNKDVIEHLKNHYFNVLKDIDNGSLKWYYTGKIDILIDILKAFDEEENDWV